MTSIKGIMNSTFNFRAEIHSSRDAFHYKDYILTPAKRLYISEYDICGRSFWHYSSSVNRQRGPRSMLLKLGSGGG